MRSKRVALYAFFDSMTQIIRSILSIYVRRIFIMTLGDGLMGLNGLFSSVVSFLSITELGFSSTVAVCLYESIAKKDERNISAYMNMLKKLYRIIGTFVLVGGAVISPMVFKMVNGEYQKEVILAGYFLHLFATAASYFFSYRGTLLYANQEGYIVSRTNLIMFSLSLIAQIIILLWKHSYAGFLACTVLQNIIAGSWLSRYANKKYSGILNLKPKPVLDAAEKIKFITKFKSMLVYRISDYLIQGADTMIISMFIGTVSVGFYNNYNLIINMCWAIFASVTNGAEAGIGNLIYTEKSKTAQTLFQLLLLQQFIFCVSVTGIFQLSSMFVTSFLSGSSLLPESFVALISGYYYIRGITYSLEVFRRGAGAYEKDKWQQLGVALLNVVISIVGCVFWGIQGVVLGTAVCYLVRGVYLTPKQMFGSVVEKNNLGKYYGRLTCYFLITIGINFLIRYILQYVVIQNLFLSFLVKGIICVLVSALINGMIFCRTEEFRYLIVLLKNIVAKRKVNE